MKVFSRTLAMLSIAAMAAGCALAPPVIPQGGAAGTLVTALPETGDYVLGSARLDVPVVGATVRLLDGAGRLIREYPNATNVNGIFALSLTEALPTRFRLVVTGGQAGAAANGETLIADYQDFDAKGSGAAVNVLTTLASRHLDSHPGVSPAAAEAAVKRYVGLPDEAALDAEAGNVFSSSTFMAAARAEGGLEAFTARLAPAIGGETTRDFAPTAQKFFGSLMATVGVELAKGALGKIGGELMGYGLSELGLADDTAQRNHAEVMGALEAQKRQLDEIKGQITGLSREMRSIADELKAELAKTNYDTQAAALRPTLGEIDDLYNLMLHFMEAGPNRNLYRDTAEFRKRVKDKMGAALSTIDHAMRGDGSGSGMIDVWAKVSEGRLNPAGTPLLVDNRFLRPVNAMTDYYHGYQLKALILLLEVYHMDPEPNKVTIGNYVKTYTDNIQEQTKLRGFRVLSDVENAEILIDRRQKLMWTRKPVKVYHAWRPGWLDVSDFNFVTGKWGRGPSLVFTADNFNGRFTDVPTTTGANAFKGWRTPTAEELAKLWPQYTPTSEPRLSHTMLRNSGMDIPADTKAIASSTWNTYRGINTLVVLLPSRVGVETVGTSEALRLYAVRPIADFNEGMK